MRFAFIEAEKALFPIRVMCRVLQVTVSGFYAWRKRPKSEHARRDEQLAVKVRAFHRTSRGTYGSPRVCRDLRAEGEGVGRKRVARIMREQGIRGCPPRRFRKTTDSNHSLAVAKNLVGRNFRPAAPDQLWATDITYVRTWEGWLYLAVVLDLYSRRVVGWASADHMHTELVANALQMAIDQRRPGTGVLHHSDRGSQYASHAYRGVLDEHGFIASMSRKGDCWDNAVVESFFGTLKQELIHRHPWPSRSKAKAAINEYIACFYNCRRRHSTLDYMSPMEYEAAAYRELACAA